MTSAEPHNTETVRFPEERETTQGRFSGVNGRLIHINPRGALRDYSYPLTGQTGLVNLAFGLRPIDDRSPVCFDPARTTQRYVNDSGLVETVHKTEYGTVIQYDLAVEDTHITHFVFGDVSDVELIFSLEFTPDGRNERLAQLQHDDVTEVYHADEADYFASATGFRRLQEPLLVEPSSYDSADSLEGIENGHDETSLVGTIDGAVPVSNGTVTLGSLLTSRTETDRQEAITKIRSAIMDIDVAVLRQQALGQMVTLPELSAPYKSAIATDLRVLSSLTGRTGLYIAGPEFDPEHIYSGGYGYSWFRDNAEIARRLLSANRHFGFSLEDQFKRNATAYRTTQLDNGTWPHRVWPFDGTLAPGWANSPLEDGNKPNYQADQTASTVSFLAEYNGQEFRDAIESGIQGLDASLASDGRPVTCENAWEDMTGRFTHTAATFLSAYSTVAAMQAGDIAAHATEQSHAVYDALDDLWVPEREAYALREYGSDQSDKTGLDTRMDSATFALIDAHYDYAQIEGIEETRLNRLVSHVETLTDELYRNTGSIKGLVRYEGDEWRRDTQNGEKVWTVSTAWGANSSAVLSELLRERGDNRSEAFSQLAQNLLVPMLPGGSLCLDSGHLPEQFFDDGTPDSATPLGWSHALRTATIARLDRLNALGSIPEGQGS